MDPKRNQEFSQGTEVDRLGKMSIATSVVRAFPILQCVIASYSYDGHVRQVLLPARRVDQRESTLIAEVNIEQDGVRQRFRRNPHETFLESLGEDGLVTFALQPVLEHLAEEPVIFHNQNSRLHRLSVAGSKIGRLH